MLDSFMKEDLIQTEIDTTIEVIKPVKKLNDKKPMTIAGIYKRLFANRLHKLPDHIMKDLKDLENGKTVSGDNVYIAKEFSSFLVNVFKCVNKQSTSKEINCHLYTWRGFVKVTQLLWFVSNPKREITKANIHYAFAFSIQRYVQGLIKVVNKLSGVSQPKSRELKEVKNLPWEKIFKFAEELKCDDCDSEVLYYCGNSMFESIDDLLKVLWNYKISHPMQFGMIPSIGGEQIEQMIGKMISDKPANTNSQDDDDEL